MKKTILLFFFIIFLFNKNLLSKANPPFILNAQKIVNNHNKLSICQSDNLIIDVNILDKFIFSENGYERTGDDWNLIYNLGV